MDEQNTTNQPMPQNDAPHSELEAIKNEIITKMNDGHNKSLPWGNIAVTVVLGALTLISVGQMVESVYVFNKLKSGNIGPATGASSATSPQNAPNMVGGC